MSPDEVTSIAQRLMKPEFVFQKHQQGLMPLKIERKIGHNECIDILPTLKRIYHLTINGRTKKSSELISELTGLLVAADLGIARDFLIELEVKKVLPNVIKVLNNELEASARDSGELNDSI